MYADARPLTIRLENSVVTPPGSFEPWQVAAAILVLLVVLVAFVKLATINPWAGTGLVPVLAAIGILVQQLLRPGR